MNELLQQLSDSIDDFTADRLSSNITEKSFDYYCKTWFKLMGDIYKDPSIKVYLPLDNNDVEMVYENQGDVFRVISLVDDKDVIPDIKKYKKIDLKNIIYFLYENNINYKNYHNLDATKKDGVNIEEVKEYVKKYPWFAGLEVFSVNKNYFYFEHWMINAIFYLGIGASEVNMYDPETGETVFKTK